MKIVDQGCVHALEVEPTVQHQIREKQAKDEGIQEIKKNLRRGKALGFSKDEQGVLWFGHRLCVRDSKR